jgi:hypothetical protein
MSDLVKGYWSTSDKNISLLMPISKIDVEKRIVSGWATTDSVDRQGDIVSSEASSKAFETFRGNVREQHTPLAVGKVINFKEDKYFDDKTDKINNGIYVDVYVSKGAEDTWYKIQEGVLTGFSIGGNILDSQLEKIEGYDKPVRVIKDYELQELSLVDNPANPDSNIVSIQKVNATVEKENYLENVFYLEEEDLIILSEKTDMQSPNTGKAMHNIGFVETNDSEKSDVIKLLKESYMHDKKKGDDKKMKYEEEKDIDKGHKYKKKKMSQEKEKMHYEDEEDMDKATSLRVGDFVSWNSSGGTARGKVVRIARSGSIKVPGSSFTINAQEDDPAVLIQVYRRGADGYQATDTRVGHKMSTLKKIPKLGKVLDYEFGEEEAVEVDNLLKSIVNFIKKEAINLTNKETVEEIIEKSEDAVDLEQDAEAAEEVVAEEDVVEEVEAVEEAVIEKTFEESAENTVDLAKSIETVNESIKSLTADIAPVIKELQENLSNVTKSLESVKLEINAIKEDAEKFGKRVDAVEAETAFRKSGDLGGVVQEPKIKKSMWDGRFLNSADLYR